MKKLFIVSLLSLMLFTSVRVGASDIGHARVLVHNSDAYSQQLQALPNWIVTLIKAAADQVMKAMNIALQRLQNQSIKEQNEAKILEGIIHADGMKKAIEIGGKIKDLYDKYYDDLKRAKDIIFTLKELYTIGKLQVAFQSELGDILTIASRGKFTSDEVNMIRASANMILAHAVNNVNDITKVVTSLTMTMDDADRLTLVRDTSDKILRDLQHMRSLRSDIAMISALRNTPEKNSLEQFF